MKEKHLTVNEDVFKMIKKIAEHEQRSMKAVLTRLIKLRYSEIKEG